MLKNLSVKFSVDSSIHVIKFSVLIHKSNIYECNQYTPLPQNNYE